MSHRHVQIVIGRLLTDEGLRDRFLGEPAITLAALRHEGVELTSIETTALLQTDMTLWESAAARLDSRLQRCNLKRSCEVSRDNR